MSGTLIRLIERASSGDALARSLSAAQEFWLYMAVLIGGLDSFLARLNDHGDSVLCRFLELYTGVCPCL